MANLPWQAKLSRMREELDYSICVVFPDINNNYYLRGTLERREGGQRIHSGHNASTPAQVVSAAWRGLTDDTVYRLNGDRLVRFDRKINKFVEVSND